MTLDPQYLPGPRVFLPSGALVDTQPRMALDVVNGFAALRDRGDRIGSWDDERIPEEVYQFQNFDGGETRTHFQGVQRLGRHPLLVVSGGDRKNSVSHLFLVQCTPRSTWGPLGSNLWLNDDPPGADRLRRIIGLDRDRWHAGGISVLGDIVAVPLEGKGNARVVFLDLSTPEEPRWAQELTEIECDTPGAGAAALTRTLDGHFLCAVWRDERKELGEQAGRIDFWISESTVPSDRAATTFEPRWRPMGTWIFRKERPEDRTPDNPHYQNISFVWDRDTRQLFLIATRNTDVKAPNDPGEDWADLFGILPPAEMADPGSPGPRSPSSSPALDYVMSRRFRGADEFCNFAGGAGAYVSESGALSLYGAFHFRGDSIFRLSEFWGHVAAGPTWWVDVFDRPGFSGRRLSVLSPEEDPIVNYGERRCQGQKFGDTVVSARFCLPPGTRYRLFRERQCPEGAGPNECFDLRGTGTVVEIPDLQTQHPGFGRRVRSSSLVG